MGICFTADTDPNTETVIKCLTLVPVTGCLTLVPVTGCLTLVPVTGAGVMQWWSGGVFVLAGCFLTANGAITGRVLHKSICQCVRFDETVLNLQSKFLAVACSLCYDTNTIFYHKQPRHKHEMCFYIKFICKSDPFVNIINHIHLLSLPDICSSCFGVHQVAADVIFHCYNTLQDDLITHLYINRLEILRRF